jgi:hypothetical protein
MRLEESIEQALHSQDPVGELRSLAQRLISQGQDQAAILALFEHVRQRLRHENREADEDAVMDVMDFLMGWCSPHMKLFQDPS